MTVCVSPCVLGMWAEARIERGQFFLDVYVPSGTELFFSFYASRQAVLSADHAVAIFPSPRPESGGRTQVNSVVVHDGLSTDFGLVEQEHVSVHFEHFRRAKAVVFDSVRGLKQSQDQFAQLKLASSAVAPSPPPSPPSSPSPSPCVTGSPAELLAVLANPPRPPPEQRIKSFERDWLDTSLRDILGTKPEHLAKVKAVFQEHYEYLVALYRSMVNVVAKDSQLITKCECVAFCLSAELIDHAKVTQQQVEQFLDKTCLAFFERGDKEVGGHGRDESGSVRELPSEALVKRGHFFDILFRAVYARGALDAEDAALLLMHHFLLPYLPAPTDNLLRSHLSTGPLQLLYQTHLDALHITFRSHADDTRLAMNDEGGPAPPPVEKAPPKGKKAKAEAAAKAAAEAAAAAAAAKKGGVPAAPVGPVVVTKEMIAARNAQQYLANQVKPLSSLVISVKNYFELLGELGIVVTPFNRKPFMRTFMACQNVAFDLQRGRGEIMWPEFLEAMARVCALRVRKEGQEHRVFSNNVKPCASYVTHSRMHSSSMLYSVAIFPHVHPHTGGRPALRTTDARSAALTRSGPGLLHHRRVDSAATRFVECVHVVASC
jgi:hypothetical protein